MKIHLLRILDVYGNELYVSRDDYDLPRRMIPLRFKTGLKWSHHPIKCHDPGGCVICRENIAAVSPVGEVSTSQSEDAK